jgi:hypothetical protein
MVGDPGRHAGLALAAAQPFAGEVFRSRGRSGELSEADRDGREADAGSRQALACWARQIEKISAAFDFSISTNRR